MLQKIDHAHKLFVAMLICIGIKDQIINRSVNITFSFALMIMIEMLF